MFFYIVKWSILYLILILLMHNIYLFFEKNLTTTKVKDFVTMPSVEYNKINSIISTNPTNVNLNNNTDNELINDNNLNKIDDNEEMKNELNEFLSKLNN